MVNGGHKFTDCRNHLEITIIAFRVYSNLISKVMARETCRAAGKNEACRAIWLPSLIAWYYNLHYGSQSVFYLTTKFQGVLHQVKERKEKKRKTESERGKNGERQARRKNIQRATKFLRNRIQVNPGIHSIFLFGCAIHFLPVERDSNAAFFFFIASLLKKKKSFILF